MKIFFFLLFVFSVHSFLAQNDKAVKKLEKLLGDEFVRFESKAENLSPPNEPNTSKTLYKNEFVTISSVLKHNEISNRNWLKKGYVSNSEFEEFQKWAVDSLMRETLFWCLVNDDESNKIIYPNQPKSIAGFTKADSLLYPKITREDREFHNLNWNFKLDYHNPEYVPCLSHLWTPIYRRYCNKITFDKSKTFYRYTQKNTIFEKGKMISVPLNCNILVENYAEPFAANSIYDRDRWEVLAKTYTTHFKMSPHYGTSLEQAKAFCDWKQKQLQNQLDKKKFGKYKVFVDLPVKENLKQAPNFETSISIPLMNATNKWKITVKEYSDFVDFTVDSVFRDFVYFHLLKDKDRIKLLQYKSQYYDENGREYVELDPSDDLITRAILNLDFSTKIKKKWLVELTGVMEKFRRKEITFRYVETFIIDENNVVLNYKRNEVSIAIDTEVENPNEDDLVKGITYEQACAFYYWKYPIHLINEKGHWTDYVLPSKEQFEAVQRGEKVILPEEIIEFPTPVFRYVVHLVKKEG